MLLVINSTYTRAGARPAVYVRHRQLPARAMEEEGRQVGHHRPRPQAGAWQAHLLLLNCFGGKPSREFRSQHHCPLTLASRLSLACTRCGWRRTPRTRTMSATRFSARPRRLTSKCAPARFSSFLTCGSTKSDRYIENWRAFFFFYVFFVFFLIFVDVSCPAVSCRCWLIGGASSSSSCADSLCPL